MVETTPPNKNKDHIEVIGARVHNLKDVDLRIPRNQLVVITGISGSGKSSLAFDTIYAEGQRRYMETFSAYARQFIGEMERPDVEQITGLSPVISIEQKTTGRNPRSTVGTVTEIYDFLRLLFARVGQAYSHKTGKKMVRYNEDQMLERISTAFENQKISLLAPLVRGRKGHYRELFDQIRKQGYTKMRVDGVVIDIEPGMQIDRYKVHDIEVVIDRIKVMPTREQRLQTSLATALKMGNGLLFVLENETNQIHSFSKHLMDAETGISYEEPSPNSFSFNSPYGMCPHCKGLGKINSVDLKKVIPDDTKSIGKGGIVPFGESRQNLTFKQLRAIAKQFKFKMNTPINKIPKAALDIILNGGDHSFNIKLSNSQHDFTYNLAKEGIVNMLLRWYEESGSERTRKFTEEFMTVKTCPSCKGTRLKIESLHFKINDRNIGELAEMDISQLASWMDTIEPQLNKRDRLIAKEIIKEIRLRLGFLLHVGLDYLTLNRPARTLSGGESQRIRLATQIGSQLTGITYILDEPSIGLHQRDNQRLIEALRELADIGNTVLVVEHDKDIMLASDYLIDLGPGAGKLGGELVAQGIPQTFLTKNTLTAEYLREIKQIEIPKQRRKGNGKFFELKGAAGNNLKKVKIKIP
ncbi:MAG: excinuclease ABC subunit UvrA, partial [Bacteroidota bacterium]